MDRKIVAYDFRDTLFKLLKIKHTPDLGETLDRLSYAMQASFGAADSIFMSPANLASLSTMLDSKQGAPSKENDDK